ncbi:MAG: hypothetical protein P8I89_08080 [Alphaproteobacteria bacterium]|nr:hypothetical protein [Alphaproteobacteria bacterium]
MFFDETIDFLDVFLFILNLTTFNKKNYTLSEIELLRDDNLDPDMISEIVQNSLGLIQSDQIVIEITK